MISSQRDTLCEAMDNGAVVITPNQRLCLDVIHERILRSDQACIEKPLCFSYDGFLRELFQRLTHQQPHLDHPVLLSQDQIQHLFQAIIKTSRHGVCNEGLLEAVLQAWTFCKAWEIDLSHPSFDERPQTYQFKLWSQTFEQTLKHLNAITADHLVDYLSHHTLEPIDTLLWYCFDAYSPSQKKLQDVFYKNKTTLIHDDLPHQERLCYQHQAEDEHQEYEALMLWIKKKISEGKTKVGVVLPDLIQKKAKIQRHFTSHFTEDEFNISMGQSLADYPLMAHALQWITLDKTIITQHQATLLLHSPYLAYAEQEHLLRTEFFQQSPLFQEKEITYDALITALTPQTPLLAKTLGSITLFPEQASPHTWRQVFKERLLHLGFPGELTLSSLNYQCIQRINTLFDDFGALSIITPSLTQHEALHALKHLAQQTIFQPEKKNAPIQLLGLLEASGCTFDCLWVMGMTDQCLPQKARLSAFIPIELQRQYDMPHATPERELRLASQLIQRLQLASDE
ncbi:MAG: PD-(D/E)XK nuclease family protein, partial [Legionellaceae bacterium]